MKPIAIIPTYNERENIRELIAIIRSEVKYFDLHILVVDSASPDRTADVVIEMQKMYLRTPSLRYIKTTEFLTSRVLRA